MAKSFFEKLGHSLNLEESSPENEFTSDESAEDEVLDEAESRLHEVHTRDESETTTILASAGAGKKTMFEQPKKKKMTTKPKKTTKREDVVEEGQLTLDVYETENEIVIKSTIAGVEPDELDINITKDSVSIHGVRESDEEINTQDYFYQECYWGAFSRQVMLPSEIDPDKATASLKNGILTIKLPKLSKSQHKKLKVNME